MKIPFTVARIVLQDLTGVPLLVDLAAMRSAVAGLGKDASVIEPLVPVDLVVDHSVQVDWAGRTDALERTWTLNSSATQNAMNFSNGGQQAFQTFSVVPLLRGHRPPGEPGISDAGRHGKGRSLFPGHSRGYGLHTTMINGIGVVGWGVGGIEAEAGMLEPARHLPGAGSRRRPHDGENSGKESLPRTLPCRHQNAAPARRGGL